MTTVELSGALHGGDLLPMLQLLARLEQSGSLYLSGQGWSARLTVDAGRLVAASFAEARGLGALEALRLVMAEADFVYSQDGRHEREVDLAPDTLHDYLKPTGRLSLDAVPRVLHERVQEFSDRERISLQRSTLRTLLAVDGCHTIAELIDGGQRAAILMDLARLLDLGLITLQPHVAALPSRSAEGTAVVNEPALVRNEPSRHTPQPGSCPFLGFADDPDSHFSRPASLHRCFAGGLMQAVSIDHQRKLCLTGIHGTCPRLLGTDPSGHSVEASVPSGPREEGRRDSTHVNSDLSQQRRANYRQALALPGGSNVGDERAVVTNEVGLYSRLLPPISILMFVAAIVATVLVFVAPHFQGMQEAAVPASTLVAQLAGGGPRLSTRAEPTVATAQAAALVPSTISDGAGQAAMAGMPRTETALEVTPTPNETVGPVVDRRTSALAGRKPLLDTSFSAPDTEWPGHPPFITWTSGGLRVSPLVAGQFVAMAAPLEELLTNVQVTALFHKVGGPLGGGYGIIVRDHEPVQRDGSNQRGHYHVLAVGDRGEVGVWRRDDDRWIDILPWMHSDAVHAGNASNELTVRALGSQLTLIINGIAVTSQTVDDLTPGGVGVFVGGDYNEVVLDRLTVEQPPTEQ